MSDIKEIRNKIISVQNISKITRSMEMVAASKIRKTQDRMFTSRPYLEAILKITNHLVLANIEFEHPYLQERPVRRVGYIVLSTDRGLCGGLNFNIFKKTLLEIKEWHEKEIPVDLALIGLTASSFFYSMGFKIFAKITDIGDFPSLASLLGITKIMIEAYDKGQIDRLYIIGNRFINTMLQEPRIIQILPLPKMEDTNPSQGSGYYLYESDPKELLNLLLLRYIEYQVYQNVLENKATEQVARMIAMKKATDNGSDMIEDLKLVYNKVRQSSITQEINEIISGASAV